MCAVLGLGAYRSADASTSIDGTQPAVAGGLGSGKTTIGAAANVVR
jgi:hypothetical protein